MGLDMYGAPDLAFDFEAAQRVVTAADGAADALEGQTGSRASYVTAAETDFRGYYSELFAANAASAAGDRRELAVRLREVSAFMGKLVAAAREENARRRRAREYKARVEQRRRNWVDATWDQIFGEEPPPREQAKAAPVFPAEVVRQAPRSPLAGTGAGSMTSARPADLRAFASGSAGLDAAVRDWPSRLRFVAGSFMATCDFGGIDVAPVVVGFEKWLAANAEDVRWANIVAAAFEASGAGSGVATVSDAALGAALAAAGVNARRDDLAIDPAQAFGGVPTTGFVNDPVNTSTGNFIEPESDLLFAGASASLSLSRMYNSLDDAGGVFGRGWSSVLDVRLVLGDEGAAFVLHDGREIRFPCSGSGWGRASGDSFWLAAEPADRIPVLGDRLDGSAEEILVVRDNGGRWWAFAPSGSWLGTGAGPGSAVLTRHDRTGRIVGLAHERGRSIEIVYAGGRVTCAGASDGRRVDYRYDEAGRLVGVADAVGARTYEWNDAGLISRVVSAAGVVECENLYDETGRVVEQLTSFGRRVRFAYLPGRVTAVSDAGGANGNTWIADVRGRLVGVIDADDKRQSMAYDGHGNLVSVIERDGSVTVHVYDERGRKTRTVTPDGADITYGYDEHDRLLTVVTASGGVVEYGYDADSDRDPSVIVDPGGGRTRLSWRDGLLERVVDPTGVVVSLAYDGHGELIETTNAVGGTARIERDPAGRAVAAVSPSGAVTRYRYDERGLVASREDADGAVWRFEHGAGGMLRSVTDPLGAMTSFEYGPHGELTRTTDPLGRSVDRTFDVFGNVCGVRLPDGGEWAFAHDALSRLRELTDPAGNVWRSDYDVTGAVVATTDPTGVRREFGFSRAEGVATLRDAFGESRTWFDDVGRPVRTESADGSAGAVVLDSCGRPVEVLDEDGGLTLIGRDAAGRIVSVTTPAGRTSTYEYDECGRPAAAVAPDGARTTLRYNADSRPVQRRLPTGDIARIEYDLMGRVLLTSEPGRGVSRFWYDKAGRLSWLQDPWYGRRRFGYDAAGQLVRAVDGVGGVTSFEYDLRGRLVRTTDPLGGVTTRSHTETDTVSALTDPLGRVTTATVDAAGRLLSQTDPDGRRTEWAYDEAGLPTGVRVDGRPLVQIERDARTRTAVVTDRTRADGDPVVHRLRFSRLGRLIERSRGDRTTAWEYDADGARIAMTAPDGTRTEYARDPAGRVAGIHHPVFGAVAFAFDPAGRLLCVEAADTRQEWRYENGFPVAFSRFDSDGVSETMIERDSDGRVVRVDDIRYSYDAAGQLNGVSAPAGDTVWSYDAAGRMCSESSPAGVRTFEYDAAGQLLAVTGPGDERTAYEYDGSGRRVRASGSASAAVYGWDERGWLRSVTGDGRTTALWVDALGELASVGDDEVVWDSAAWSPSVVSVAGTPLGSAPGGLTGVAGSWVGAGWRPSRSVDDTDPWAVLDALTLSLGGAVSVSGAGGLVVAGLEWLGARVYDSSARGFLSTDPLPGVVGAGWSGNPYSFAGNDPVQWVDPLGLRPVTDDELAVYAQARQGVLASAGDAVGAWWGENWEYVVAGVAIAGGVALMFTGVGGPAGVVLLAASGALLSGGVSVVSQKAQNGSVDWGKVGVDTLIGGATGALGAGTGAMVAWKLGTGLGGKVATAAAGGAVEGGAGGAANYAMSPGPHTVDGLLWATAGGAAIGGMTSGVTGYQPKWLDSDVASTFAGGIYCSGYLSEGEILYRAGSEAVSKGRFWSVDAPTSVSQVRSDKAIPPTWPDGKPADITHAYAGQFSGGSAGYRGVVAPQQSQDGIVYTGGTNQVYFPDPWNHIAVMESWLLSP